LELSERRYRLSGGYRKRRKGQEDTETSDDKDCPEGEPLQGVALVFPQRQEAATASKTH